MRNLFGYQRGGPVRGGAYREQPNLPSRGDPIQDAVDAAVGGGGTSNLPPGVTPGGRYFTDPITGNPMYQPPMPEGRPGFAQAMVMPPAIDLTTGQPKPLPNFDLTQPPPQPTTAPVFPSTTTEPGMDTVGPAGTTIAAIQDAVDAAVGGGTTLPIETEPSMDTTTTTLPIETDPVQDAVDAAVGGGTKPSLSSYGPADNWSEPGYTAYNPADQFIDPIESFVEEPVSPFMDEDPLNDAWTAPVVDVLPTAGVGAGGDPTTDFAVVNNLFEPVEPNYLGDIVYPDRPDHTGVTGVDPSVAVPDPTHYDYDAGTYTDTPVVDTTEAVDDMTTTTGVGDMPTTNVVGDMTTTTGGFPDSPFEGMVHMGANNVTWIYVMGEWREVGPTGATPPVTTDPTVTTVTDPTVTTATDPTVTTVTDPTVTTVTDPTVTTVTDPTVTTVTDPTVTDPTVTTVTDPTVTGQSEVDRLNALIAELRAEQAAQQAAQQAEREAWEAQTAEATGKYTLTGPSIGYNPYVSGQYQSDPYGAAGVPNMGGLTTIPIPQPLTGIGYANYQAPENMT